MKFLLILAVLAVIAGCLLGCGSRSFPAGKQDQPGFRQISQEEAQRLMKTESGYIIADVRTREEYDEGHIPKAICIPNESIGSTPPAALPDKNQRIFVYCRTGRRSKEAARKLAALGYTDIMDFGGIQDWTGEITKQAPADG